MNKLLIKKRFSKASGSYDEEASIQRQIAERMIFLIKKFISGKINHILEIGCGTGIFSRLLLQEINPDRMFLNDICPDVIKNLDDLLDDHTIFLEGDAEFYPFPANQDLITSCSCLQWFDSPEKFLINCTSLLNEKAYLAFSTFGKDNLQEINTISGKALSYLSIKEWEEVLSERYEIIFSEEDKITLNFKSAIEVLLHMKKTGVTGTNDQIWTKSKLDSFCHQYHQLFGNKNGVSLTYHPIYILACKKINKQ